MKFLSGFLAVLALGSAWSQSYTVIDLGTFGGDGSYATAINNKGQITGSVFLQADQGSRAFRYSDGMVELLGTLGGQYSYGIGISDAGHVTGGSLLPGGEKIGAFLYLDEPMLDLGTLGANYTYGIGVNSSGEVAGYFYGGLPAGATRAFLYSNGRMHDLGTLGGTYSFGHGINEAGMVAGSSSIGGDTEVHAFRYVNGVMQDLGTLGGTISVASGLNSAGEVAGWSTVGENGFNARAFAYVNGRMQDLGTLGGLQSFGYAINASGHVTGNSDTSEGALHGFLYRDGTLHDLNDIALNSPATDIVFSTRDIIGNASGKAINDWGQISAIGTIDGAPHALLLNPTDPLISGSPEGTWLNAKLVGGLNYGQIPLIQNNDGLYTIAVMLDGVAGAGGQGVFGLNRDVTIAFGGQTGFGLASDVVSLSGTWNDVFVFAMTYDESLLAGDGALGWLDGGEWTLAVNGNIGSPGELAGFYKMTYHDFLAANGGAFEAERMLGAHGSFGGVSWAVIDHNSDFAVLAIPEPGASSLVFAGIALFLIRRRRAFTAVSDF